MMYYRRFGRTELPMPLFSCGGMRYQYQWQDTTFDQVPEANQKQLEATLMRSLELGINHIETARAYGTSEMQLGKILPKLPRERIIVQTKVCPHPDPLKFKQDFDPENQRTAFQPDPNFKNLAGSSIAVESFIKKLKSKKEKGVSIITESLKSNKKTESDKDAGTLLDENNIL